MERNLEKQVLLGAGLLIMLLVVSAVSTYRNVERLTDDSTQVLRALQVCTLDEAVMLTMVDAETGQRGFLITGKEDFLQPYNEALSRIYTQYAALKDKASDNPDQSQRVMELGELIERRLALLKEGIEIRRTSEQQAQEFIASKQGKVKMDAIRALIAQIDREERRLLDDRKEASRSSHRTAVTTTILTALIGLVVIAAATGIFIRNLRLRMQTAAILFQSRELLRATLSSIGDAVIATDEQANVTFLNPIAENLTGWRQDQALGRPLPEVFNIVNEDTRNPVENPALRALKEGVIVGLANHTVLIAKDGGERAIEDSAGPIRNAQGQVTGAVLVFRDVTAERQAAIALSDAAARKDDFLAMLGHELRNPLAGIVNSVQVLQMLDGRSEAKEMQAVIGRQSAHMSRMVDDLLDVSRIARGKLLVRREHVDLRELIAATCHDYRKSHGVSECEVRCELPSEPVWVLGDSTRLTQVMMNLLQNGCKFLDTHIDVTVTLLVNTTAGAAEILVSDRGIGMSPETLKSIFEPFHQADNTLDRSRGGLGLGLALVKGVVELHQGTVTASSDGLGKGSSILVSLPLADKPPDPTMNDSPHAGSTQAKRILLIDDRRDAVVPLQKMLSMSGHQVQTAPDGPAGLAVANDFQPQVILCDIGLSGPMNGYEVAQTIRQSPEMSGIYLVAVSGSRL